LYNQHLHTTATYTLKSSTSLSIFKTYFTYPFKLICSSHVMTLHRFIFFNFNITSTCEEAYQKCKCAFNEKTQISHDLHLNKIFKYFITNHQ